MTDKLQKLKRAVYASTALLMTAGIAASLMPAEMASAAQLSSRSIKLSDSAPSGGAITSGVGSGTGAKYTVSFTTSASASSLVIDFCKESPIIQDTCTAPTGMDASTATLTSSGGTGNVDTWTTLTASAGQVKLGIGSGTAAGAGAQVFELNNIKNPNGSDCSTTPESCSFYARIYTYSNGTYGTYASAASVGNDVDYGGIALSTTAAITIQAKVEEQITFCTSDADLSTTTNKDCRDATAPAVVLGHTSGSSTILDSTAVDTANVFTQLSTNASAGAAVKMKVSNTVCSSNQGGLSADGDATCAIPPVGTSGTPAALTAGTAGFGVFVANGTAVTGGSGTTTADPHYNDGNSAHYAMDTATAGDNVLATYGGRTCFTNSPVSKVDNTYTFAATAALTTPAGIYSENAVLIATGTF